MQHGQATTSSLMSQVLCRYQRRFFAVVFCLYEPEFLWKQKQHPVLRSVTCSTPCACRIVEWTSAAGTHEVLATAGGLKITAPTNEDDEGIRSAIFRRVELNKSSRKRLRHRHSTPSQRAQEKLLQ